MYKALTLLFSCSHMLAYLSISSDHELVPPRFAHSHSSRLLACPAVIVLIAVSLIGLGAENDVAFASGALTAAAASGELATALQRVGIAHAADWSSAVAAVPNLVDPPPMERPFFGVPPPLAPPWSPLQQPFAAPAPPTAINSPRRNDGELAGISLGTIVGAGAGCCLPRHPLSHGVSQHPHKYFLPLREVS